MEKVIITAFTDPMMGLSYESEPIMERLQKEDSGKIEFRYVMGLLVRDVSDFMTPAERTMEPEAGIRRYCERLAGIYKSEESIGGLPINMTASVCSTQSIAAQNLLIWLTRLLSLLLPKKPTHFLWLCGMQQ